MPFVMQPEAAAAAPAPSVCQVKARVPFTEQERDSDRAVAGDATPAPAERGLN